LAQSGHDKLAQGCPLLGVKRTWLLTRLGAEPWPETVPQVYEKTPEKIAPEIVNKTGAFLAMNCRAQKDLFFGTE
jgi:hypothetical protein